MLSEPLVDFTYIDRGMSPSYKSNTAAMVRTNSTPGNFESSIDRPMRLAEIYVAAEHALRNTISNPDLLNSLSSLEEFEVLSISISNPHEDTPFDTSLTHDFT